MENIVIKNIINRHSSRQFTNQEVKIEDLKELVRAGMAAPSGKDRRPWEFVIVTKRELLNQLAEALPYAKMLTTAEAAIVVCGIEDMELGGSPYWQLDCSAATQNILLAAESMGLATVWTAAYPYKERIDPTSKILSIPSHVTPLCVIPVGYPAREARIRDKFNAEKIHINKFGDK